MPSMSKDEILPELFRVYEQIYLEDLSVDSAALKFLRRVADILDAKSVGVYELGIGGVCLISKFRSDPKPLPFVDFHLLSDRFGFTFPDIPETKVLDRESRATLFGRVEDDLTVVVSGNNTEKGHPFLVLYAFPNSSFSDELLEVCTAISRELWHIIRCFELRHSHSHLIQLTSTQFLLPNRLNVMWELCSNVKNYFGVTSAALFDLANHENDTYVFEKTFIYNDIQDNISFEADHGYCHYCVKNKKALVIVDTIDASDHTLGMGYSFDVENISYDKAVHLELRCFTPPSTLQNEKSLIMVPIFGHHSGDEVVGVIKVGSMSRSHFFNISHLTELLTISRALSPILSAINVAQELDSLKRRNSIHDSIKNHADSLFYYREIALGLFHQVGNNLLFLSSHLLTMESIYDKDDALREDISKARQWIESGQALIKKAQNRGKSLEPIAKECLLIRDVMRPAIDHVNKSLDGGAWNVEHTFGDAEYSVYLDSELIRESLIAVLSNAVSAVKDRSVTMKKVVVVVRDANNADKVRIDVIDSGVGIPPENMLSSVFEPFFTTRGEDGTGLGLYFARRLLEEFDGSIEVSRSNLGKGTTMRITLPVLEKVKK